MAYYLKEINERCLKDPKDFIAECDQAYADKISLAADKIQGNLFQSPVVLLSGPSGSGKTTTAKKICEELNKRGTKTYLVSMDNYFRTVSPEYTPRTPEGNYDYESPYCMDIDLLNQHFTALTKGEEIMMPKYDFVHQKQYFRRDNTLQLKENEVVVFEGIHALNDLFTESHQEAFKLYISARSNIFDENNNKIFKGTWMRLMRRTVRDYLFRGFAAQDTLKQWANIRRGEIAYISPFKDKANLQFDSSFPYEVPVMNNMASELFNNMPEDTPRYSELMAILPAFELFEDIPTDLLAPDSLLREFVGGGIYD